MNSPNPALVTRQAAVALPRVALLALCLSWLLPGLLDRDPWRNADVIAFAVMRSMAHAQGSWWAPTLGGMPFDAPLLPHWLGASAIMLAPAWLDPAVAARLPFAMLMAASMACLWYATFNLARMQEALPLPMAFGGEAEPQDYARALADAALLALLATLGLLQLGHETTPEVVQFCCGSGWLLSLSWSFRRPLLSRAGVLLTLPLWGASGAPSIALGAGLIAAVACGLSKHSAFRRLAPWCLSASVVSCGAASALDVWRWHIDLDEFLRQAPLLARQWIWFTWPSWPLALWTLWQWRHRLDAPHLVVPMSAATAPAIGSILMGGEDRVLLLGLPGLAILASFALPTLKRSAAAAIDWFSVCFFSTAALFIWFMYVAIQTGAPAKPAANVARLAAGFVPSFSIIELILGVAATSAWLWLVRWRTGRSRHVLWKSMVLPSAGVVLCWMLLMSLWFPLLDYARSGRPIVERIQALAPGSPCLATRGASPALVASLEVFAKPPLRVIEDHQAHACGVLVTVQRGDAPPNLDGWTLAGSFRRPTDRYEIIAVHRR